MSKPINVRITDELEAKINKAVEEEKTTVTELTRKAIAEYVERRNMQTISFPIDDLNVKDLDMIYDSLTEIHQILLNNYNSCDYIDKLNRKDLGENIEHTIFIAMCMLMPYCPPPNLIIINSELLFQPFAWSF